MLKMESKQSPDPTRFALDVETIRAYEFIAHIPIHHQSFLTFKTHIVPIDVPLLIGLDILHQIWPVH